jgi:hypothetical protein
VGALIPGLEIRCVEVVHGLPFVAKTALQGGHDPCGRRPPPRGAAGKLWRGTVEKSQFSNGATEKEPGRMRKVVTVVVGPRDGEEWPSREDDVKGVDHGFG